MIEDKVWIGLDLGLARTSVCITNAEGLALREQECDSEPAALKEALAGFPIDRIGGIAAEAGTGTHIVRKLRSAGFPVSIFEARKASKFLALRRNKSDASDARGLADLVRIGRNAVSQVHLKTAECQQIRTVLVVRKRFVMMRVAAEALLRSNLALHGRRLKPVYSRKGLREQVEIEIGALDREEGIDLEPSLRSLVSVCESLRAYVEKLDAELADRAKSHEVCRLLMEVPGVGPICALSFYSAIEDPSRFRVATDVGPYLGLTPRRRQSGTVSRTFGITKSGSKLTRTHLVLAAAAFARTAPDCSLKRWYLALRERAGSKRARVALARKLAVVLLAMWKKDAHFDLCRGAATAALKEPSPTETAAGHASAPPHESNVDGSFP